MDVATVRTLAWLKSGRATRSICQHKTVRCPVKPIEVMLLVAATATASCGVAESASTVTVSDSLGVRLVQNHGAAGIPGIVPRLDSAEPVRIGTVDGDARYQFFRLSGAVRLSSGTIVVAVGGTQDVRWFGANGEWIRSVGGHGSGPGEFQWVRSLLRLPGDSILIEDPISARMTLYDANGRFVRSWLIGADRPSPIGRLADGGLVAIPERTINEPPGFVRFEAAVVRYTGGTTDTIGTFAGSESFTMMCGPDNSGLCNLGLPYGPDAVGAVSDDAVFVGNGATYEIRRFTPSAGLTAIIRRDEPLVPLTAERVAWQLDSLLGAVPPVRREMMRERLVSRPAPATMAAFSQIIADDVGRIWVGRPAALIDGSVGLKETREWDVFDADGRFIGAVALPTSLRVMSISDGHIVGIALDDDGVEYVEVHRLSGTSPD